MKNKFEPYKFDDTNEESQEIISDCNRWGANPQLIQFILHLNHIGLFARPYGEGAQLRCQALYSAAQVIHQALCAIDSGYLSRTKHTTIRDFANAWSYADGDGNRRHKD